MPARASFGEKRFSESLAALEQIQGELDTSGNYVTIPFIRELLGKVPNSGWYYSDEFEQNALAIFDSCDTNKDSVLTGRELQVALLAFMAVYLTCCVCVKCPSLTDAGALTPRAGGSVAGKPEVNVFCRNFQRKSRTFERFCKQTPNPRRKKGW